MCAGQRKPRVAVFSNREGRAMEIQDGMTVFASVLVWRGGKLFVVSIFVAIRAGREFHLVNCVFPGREMALSALNRNVLASQRIA